MAPRQEEHHPIDRLNEKYGIVYTGQRPTHDLPSAFGYKVLESAGLYIAGPDPAQRTELLTQHLIQWALEGCGFCYLHHDYKQTLALLSKLPADRLDDVIWIDIDRDVLIDFVGLDVPRTDQITIPPLALHEATDEYNPKHLVTHPAQARLTDVLDVVAHSVPPNDWASLAFLESLLQVAIVKEYTIHDVMSMLDSLGDLSRRYNEDTIDFSRYEPPIGRAVRNVLERDPSAIWRVVEHLQKLTGDPYGHIFSRTQPCSFSGAIGANAIILVAGTGTQFEGSNYGTAGTEMLTTHLVAGTVIRRIWEEAQHQPFDRSRMYPIAIDCVDTVLADDALVLREIINHHEEDEQPTRVTPWLAGPAPLHLPWHPNTIVDIDIGAWVLIADDPEDPNEALTSKMKELVSLSEKDDYPVPVTFSEWPVWMAKRGSGPWRVEPYPRYPRKRTDAEMATAITPSSTADGE